MPKEPFSHLYPYAEKPMHSTISDESLQLSEENFPVKPLYIQKNQVRKPLEASHKMQ